jgi:hypothetical protein
MDAEFIAKCADPDLKPAIVQQFLAAVGSDDPLAITVKENGRLVLIPRPRSPDEALQVAKEYLGHAVVRVGITQYPAGVGIADASQLQPNVFDACENVQTGTAIFAKVGRIVTKWYGRPTNTDLLPQMLDDAIYAWKTGNFEGANVFRAEDPGGPTFFGAKTALPTEPDQQAGKSPPDQEPEAAVPATADAGIRIDLSRIGGAK